MAVVAVRQPSSLTFKISILADSSSDYRSTAFFIKRAVCNCLLPHLLHFHLSRHLNSSQPADREEEREADGPKDAETERRGELPVSDLIDIQTAVLLPVTGSTGVCNKPQSKISADLRGLA